MGLTSTDNTDYSYCDILSSDYMQRRILQSAKPKSSPALVLLPPPSAFFFFKLLIISVLDSIIYDLDMTD